MKVQISPLTLKHAFRSAQLHRQGMPNDFLPSFGTEFLFLLHTLIIESDKAIALGYFKNMQLQGIIVGVTDRQQFMDEVIQKSWFKLFPIVLIQLLSKPMLLFRIVETFRYANYIKGRPQAELIILSVDQQFRRKKIGSKLMQYLKVQFRRKSVRTFDVGTTSTNIAANKFYIIHGGEYQKTFSIYGRRWNLYKYHL